MQTYFIWIGKGYLFNLVINAFKSMRLQYRVVNGQFVISYAAKVQYQIWNWPVTTRHCDHMLKHLLQD